MNKAEIVEEMLGILDSPEHWCKFLLWDGPEGERRHCLMGALNKAVYGHGSGLPNIRDYNPDTVFAANGLVKVMDQLACEKGYVSVWDSSRTPPIGSGAHAVHFNNAPETEYEDLRLFLKETLERVS